LYTSSSNWNNICRFFYTRVLILKHFIYLLFFLKKSNSFYVNNFKYFLVHKELNYFKVINKYKKNI
jgi:hypothetical protein